ncbi:IFNL3 protein, partial [Oxylabes madagascariensis]|nr:IFNL3 protein [Oxylabes madagascariensis]
MSCLSLAPLLVLVLGVSLGAAFPHDTLRKGCRLSKYQNIAHEEQKAVDKMRQEFFFSLSLGLCPQVNNHKCNTRLFHRKWNAVDLPMSDRVVLVAAELNLTTAMLELPAVPSFAEARRRPLDFFTQAREDVRGCPLSLQVDPSHQPSGRLRHWLHKLQAALRTVSQASGGRVRGVPARGAELTPPVSPPQDSAESRECLRATAVLHVLRVLDNLRCAALQDKC